MTALIRTFAAAAALSSTALFGTGCDLLDAFQEEGTTLVQLMVTHNATPEDGRFPDLADGDLRTFDTDEGWTVYLQAGFVTTTGASIETRISLTSVAVSPVSGPMEKPAPTTCATSWMVPPRNTPESRASKWNTCASIG